MLPFPDLLRFEFENFSVNAKTELRKLLTQNVLDRNEDGWQLVLDPCYPTIALSNKNKKADVEAAVSIILRNKLGAVANEQKRGVHHFKAGRSRRFFFLDEWTKIIDKSNNIITNSGSLVIEIEIQRVKHSRIHIQNPFAKNMLHLLESGHMADMTFEVQDARIKAHKLILEANAPMLASFCEGADEESPVPMYDTKPEVFRHVLQYVYGGVPPSKSVIEKCGASIIHAADRYGVVNLKLAVEHVIVGMGLISIHNVVDFLLFADAHSCALLRETAMAYFVARAKDIFKLKTSSKLSQSAELMHEIMFAVLYGESELSAPVESDYSTLSVSALRCKLNQKGLELDGSKKMLIARLEASRSKKTHHAE
ncbi:hypothetical protein ACHAXS_011939 [Conticribra weissflogii]